MTETQTDVQINTGFILPDLMTSTSRPFIPEVLPPDHLPAGIPIPSPEIAQMLQHAGGNSMVGHVGLRHLRQNGHETVFPVCITDNGDMPIFTSMSKVEFARRYGFSPKDRFIELLRGYVHATAIITGGADTGLQTAQALEAVEIFNHARPSDRQRLDSVLQQDYGLPNPPSTYAQKLTSLDEAFAADDQGRALNFFSYNRMMPLEAARDVVIKNPGLFLSYLIRTVTLWSHAAEVQNFGPLVDQLERTVGSAMEANLGQLLDSNDFVYANINTAVSMLGDLVMARRHPNLYRLADEILTNKFGISPEIRQNSRYLTALFNRFLVDRKIVREEDLDTGDIITRASVKAPASLLGKAVVSPRVMDSIFDGMGAMGLDGQRPDAASPRATKASWGIRTLSQILDQKKVKQGRRARLVGQRVLEEVTEEMMAQDDVLRAQVDFRDPAPLNHAVRGVRDILGIYPSKVREKLGKKARAEMFATWDAADKSGALLFPIEHAYEPGYDSENPAGWMVDWVKGLPRPSSFYTAAHTYFPVVMGQGELRLLDPQEVMGLGGKPSLGCEGQFALRKIRPANKLHRLYYNSQAKMAGSVRLPVELMGAVQDMVLNNLPS